MVGPGTGIAPFRAFIEHRKETEATGRNWLFFGEVHEETTFFYKDEWTRHMKEENLYKLTTAFSRDQKHKIYVQDRLLNNGKEVWDWLNNGAYFYVCGDKKYMAKDVHSALIKIAEKEGKMKKNSVITAVIPITHLNSKGVDSKIFCGSSKYIIFIILR